jgi:hypothetical protein
MTQKMWVLQRVEDGLYFTQKLDWEWATADLSLATLFSPRSEARECNTGGWNPVQVFVEKTDGQTRVSHVDPHANAITAGCYVFPAGVPTRYQKQGDNK